MPARIRSKRVGKAGGRSVVARSTAREPARSSSRVSANTDDLEADEESDDPLAMTPLQPARTQRPTQKATKSSSVKGRSRVSRGRDRVVGGVEMAEGDLIPPSDEEEFDAWAVQRLEEKRQESEMATSSTRSRSESARPYALPSSPTEMLRSRPSRMSRLQHPSSHLPTTARAAPGGEKAARAIKFSLFSQGESSSNDDMDTAETASEGYQEAGAMDGLDSSAADAVDVHREEQSRRAPPRYLEPEGVRRKAIRKSSRFRIAGPARSRSPSTSLSPPPPESLRPAVPVVVGADLATKATSPTVDIHSAHLSPHSTVQHNDPEHGVKSVAVGVQPITTPKRAPLYSTFTPKRRSMDADDRSPLQPRSFSQPISPFQPPPSSFDESQYNQQGALRRSLSPHLIHHASSSQITSPASAFQQQPDQADLRSPSRPATMAGLPTIMSGFVDGIEAAADDSEPLREASASSASNQPSKAPEPPPPPPIEVVDPALRHFRSSRTFRTRTALQLQPYTRERQVYEAVLRRGGLKNGKHAIARPKDISSDEDEDEEEVPPSPESTPASQAEVIVIGSTPETIPVLARRQYKPIDITEEDRTEYFLSHGTRPSEGDGKIEALLQKIARKRKRSEKERKMREREERKAKRLFESFLRKDGDHGGLPDVYVSVVLLIQDSISKAIWALQARLMGSTSKADSQDDGVKGPTRTTKRPEKTYKRPVAAADPPGPPKTPQGRAASESLSPLHFELPRFSPQTPVTSRPSAALQTAQSLMNDFPEYQDSNENPAPHLPLPRRQSISSEGEMEGATDSEDDIQDKRVRIARRMLPAAMLKRLEKEAAEKAKRTSKTHRTQKSPELAPGKAIRRRGNGEVDIREMFEDEASSDSARSASPASHGGQPDYPIYDVPDSSDLDDDGSQAEEDNRGGETLARLYDGDFESIVRGRVRPAKTHHRPPAKVHRKRPTVGLASRSGRSRADNRSGNLVQTRLHFDREISPAPGRTKIERTAQHTAKRTSSRQTRPAIRLDERTIFSDRDFDLDTAEPEPAINTARSMKVLQSVATAASATPQLQARIDADIGKAKSWANFERFSVDFDISPLPSGLKCSGFPVDRVASLINVFHIPSIASTDIESAEDLGISFSSELDDQALESAIDGYFDALGNCLFGVDPVIPQGAGTIVEFLSYSLRQRLPPGRSDASLWVQSLSLRLDLLEQKSLGNANTQGHVSRDRQPLIFGVLWYILELRLALATRLQTQVMQAGAYQTSVTIFRLLLVAGFDRAIRPLKICLRGESINGKMTDLLTSVWISIVQALSAYLEVTSDPDGFDKILLQAIAETFHLDPIGPIAAERIWYITFGLGAITQFNEFGRTTGAYQPVPRWGLVRKALSIIKIAHEEEAEERSHGDLLRGRDRYVRVMVARCIRLSSVWQWDFTRETFAIVTRDLGPIFKQRQYRNFPSEPPIDYPDWITSYDITKTGQPESKHETAFEMYLRLVCVAASDIIGVAESLDQAQQAEKDVQRLVMSIMPISPVKFNRLFPPTPKQLAQLVNRYATMVAACYFSPSILPWLLSNSRKWTAFESADFESRQITIRGLMYVAVACRHHDQPLLPIIARLSEILQQLAAEKHAAATSQGGPSGKRTIDPVETSRTMVLVVSCLKQIILNHSFGIGSTSTPRYPDPALLDPSWTSLIFDLSARDFRSGLEVVSAIQAFLDTRLETLPPRIRKARDERIESQDEFGSLGFELDPVTVAHLGGAGAEAAHDVLDERDGALASIIQEAICPRIYRLLSDILGTSDVDVDTRTDKHRSDFLRALSRCWSDCAAVLVIDHRRLDWSTFIGSFGQQSWLRFGDDIGRLEVGLLFMLNVLRLDPSAFGKHQEDFISLFFSVIATDRVTVEHHFISLLFHSTTFFNHPLFDGCRETWGLPAGDGEIDQEELFAHRVPMLEVIFGNMQRSFTLVQSGTTLRKPFLYRCINDLVSSLERCLHNIPEEKVIHKQSYLAFAHSIVRSLQQHLGVNINPHIVPALKSFASVT